jgi:cytochrome c-type biogenesis protein CcmH
MNAPLRGKSARWQPWSAVLLGAALLFASASSLAVDAEDTLTDPVLRTRYESINRELRCLVCQNQTIADSDADLAKDLRREVRGMLEAGKTDAEIRGFMTERYGDFVLYKPRSMVLWAAPAVLLLGGLVLVGRIVVRRSRSMATAAPDPDDSLANDEPDTRPTDGKA